jgi:hypothetical protein
VAEAPVRHLDVERIVVDADQPLAIEQQLGEVADAAARLEDALPMNCGTARGSTGSARARGACSAARSSRRAS